MRLRGHMCKPRVIGIGTFELLKRELILANLNHL